MKNQPSEPKPKSREPINSLANKIMKALVIVDIQNDFLPGGALAVPAGEEIIPLVNQLQRVFPLVVATQDWHPANHGSFAANHPGRQPFEQIDLHGLPQTLWPVHCVQNQPGADFAPGLERARVAQIFVKGADPTVDSYSGLYDNGQRNSTGLGEWLRDRGVTDVYVCGLATDYCVKFTALDAARMGFKTWFIEDASRGVNLQPDDSRRAIAEMNHEGIATVQSAELLAAAPPAPAPVTLFAGRFLALRKIGSWEFADRVNASDAVLIAALTPEHRLLLVEQYRIPVGARTLELPAGLIGDEPGDRGESTAAAARRELLEETGYAADKLEAVTSGPSCSGITSERVTLFLATGLRRVGPGGGVSQENITVHEVPRTEVYNWLVARSRTGVLIDPKIYAALFFLNLPV